MSFDIFLLYEIDILSSIYYLSIYQLTLISLSSDFILSIYLLTTVTVTMCFISAILINDLMIKDDNHKQVFLFSIY